MVGPSCRTKSTIRSRFVRLGLITAQIVVSVRPSCQSVDRSVPPRPAGRSRRPTSKRLTLRVWEYTSTRPMPWTSMVTSPGAKPAPGHRSPSSMVWVVAGSPGSRSSAGCRTAGVVAAWDLPGYGASTALAAASHLRGLGRRCGPIHRRARRLGPCRRHVVRRNDRPVPGRRVPGSCAITHPDVHQPEVRARRHRPGCMAGGARLGSLDRGETPADFAHAVLGGLAGPLITPGALAGQVAAMARISSDALRSSIECLVTHDSRALLSAIVAPTQCLVGSVDRETPAAYSEAIAVGIGAGTPGPRHRRSRSSAAGRAAGRGERADRPPFRPAEGRL